MSRVVILAIAYLLGAVPFGFLLGRLARGIDVRRQGSGNIGATNVARAMGWGVGALTLALDVGKGAGAVLLARWLLDSEIDPILAGLAAVAGHVFPIYLGFSGGKGVATGCGAFLILAPAATLAALGVFAVTVLATRRVSPGSILGTVSLPVFLAGKHGWSPLVAAGFVSAALIIFRHRENIMNLLAGREPRLGEGKMEKS